MFNIQQHIYVGTIKIESISNSSMLQIGTSGGMSATSYVSGQTATGTTSDGFPVEDFYSPSLVPLPNPN